jgi:TolB-like protein
MKRLLLAVLTICSLGAGISNAQDREIRGITDKLAESLAQSGKKTVAVVDFTDLQGNVTELGRFLAEEISASLAESAKGIEVVDRTNLKVIIQENKLAATGIIDPATARKLGQVAGVDSLITGTLTPFGDSVHLSVKILDTATARIVGATRGDIPKTKAIEELLGQGVATANSGPRPQAPSPPNAAPSGPAQAGVSAKIGDFQISIPECRRAGNWTHCAGLIVNQGAARMQIGFTPSSYIIDNLGNQSENHSPGITRVGWQQIQFGGFQTAPRNQRIQIQVGSEEWNSILEPGIPVKLRVSALGLSDQAVSVSIVLRLSTPEATVTLRNIPIQR